LEFFSWKSSPWNKDELIERVNWLTNNIYVTCGDSMLKQIIGIPMGTDCAPFLANLFLFAYAYKWLTKKFKTKEFDDLKKFNDAVLQSHYLDFDLEI
jgi:hypothetical protein